LVLVVFGLEKLHSYDAGAMNAVGELGPEEPGVDRAFSKSARRQDSEQ
jgi:hypothetical protein